MKKIYFLFVIIFLSMFMVSCKGSKEKELKRFFNSHSVDLTFKMKYEKQEIEILKIIGTKEATSVQFSNDLTIVSSSPIIIDQNNNMFYDLGTKIVVVELDDEESEEIDIYEYISNIEEDKEKLTFDFDVKKYLEQTDMDFGSLMPVDDMITFTCLFEDKKITKLEYEVENVKVIMQVNNYAYKRNVKPEDIGIEEIEVPKIENCLKLTEEELGEHIATGASGDVDNYVLVVDAYTINATKESDVETDFAGYIFDDTNNVKVKNLSIEDIYFEKQVNNVAGIHYVKAYCDYAGKKFSTETTVKVNAELIIENKIISPNIKEIFYGFNIDEYTYICDDRYIYKFDVECKTLYGKLDLQCKGKAHYVKDGYVYVAAYFPYTTTYNDSDAYDGSITQIKLSDFTIEKQVHVNCLPESIVVDNRGNVFISKGANQHVDNEQVDMETGALQRIFDGYQKDILLYDSHNDAITVVTAGHSGNNELYQYDGKTWLYKGYSSISDTKIFYTNNDFYVTSSGIYRYNSFANSYVLEKFEYYKNGNSYIGSYLVHASVNDEKAYLIEGSYFDEVVPQNLIIYDLKTKGFVRESVAEEYKKEMLFMYSYSDYLYIVNKDGSVTKIKI